MSTMILQGELINNYIDMEELLRSDKVVLVIDENSPIRPLRMVITKTALKQIPVEINFVENMTESDKQSLYIEFSHYDHVTFEDDSKPPIPDPSKVHPLLDATKKAQLQSQAGDLLNALNEGELIKKAVVEPMQEVANQHARWDWVDLPFVENFGKHVHRQLPMRADEDSAGYDIFSPIDFEIPPHGTYKLYTDVRIWLPKRQFLWLTPKSGKGSKGLHLRNVAGIIDGSYYNNPDTGGNIIVVLYNNSEEPMTFEKGDALIQGIILPYFTAFNDSYLKEERDGGFGSSFK